MTLTQLLLSIYALAGALIVLLLVLIFIQKRHHKNQLKRTKMAREYFYQLVHKDYDPKRPNLHPKIIFDEFFNLEDQVRFSKEERNTILNHLPMKEFLKIYRRRLKALSRYKRMMAAQYLSLLQTEASKELLKKRLSKEASEPVKFYLVNGLIPVLDEEILEEILSSCEDTTIQYTRRVAHLLSNHYQELYPFLTFQDQPGDVTLFFYATLAKKEPSLTITTPLEEQLDDFLSKDITKEDHLAYLTREYLLEALLVRDSELLKEDAYLHHESFDVRKYSYLYLAKKEKIENITLLLTQIDGNEEEQKFITNAIQASMSSNKLFDDLLPLIDQLQTDHQKQALASVLSSKIEFLIMELDKKDNAHAVKAISFIIKKRHTAGLVGFINRNKNRAIEDALFSIIRPIIQKDEDLKEAFTNYVQEDILKRHKLQKTSLSQPKRDKAPVEKAKIIWMLLMLLVILLTYPFLSFLDQQELVLSQPLFVTFQRFILDTNRNLVYYFMSANLIYLLLLVISLRGAKKQRNLWKIKNEQLLYEEDILPAISIIAPAYNEELSIIASTLSLLNLKYPSYEVVVVNDGSKDQTLQKLIDHFDLKRADANYNYELPTKEIRGIYTNHNYPKLKVVNKVNGGKADALNVGINVASSPYVCGIDADSVLEQEALLRLMSITLDHKNVPVALGGNIVPANGCKIDHGYVEEKRLPKELLPRFQSLEYLRAFTSGRIGWSSIHSLLIISGAFGLFRKEDITKIGGYITSSGALKKDSVGEDMELVVRLTHDKLKQKEPYLVSYVYHANCYTELPSDAKTLLKQRNRWHRGLIDILSYHRHILLNPRYKQVGLFAVPYFYIFEVMGPFFELIGYLAVIVSFILGFLEPLIVLGIFGASIAMGVVLSLSSLYIAETVNTYTTKKDVFILLLFAFLENFGYRQLISLHRAYSFFTALFESGAWGEQKRKGL